MYAIRSYYALEQRGSERLDLRAVVFYQFARKRVLLVDDAPNFGIDLLHRRLGNVLVRGDRATEEYLAVILAVEDSLPRPEIQLPVGNGNDDRNNFV